MTTVDLILTPALLHTDSPGFFAKGDTYGPAFDAAGGVVTLKAGARIALGGRLHRFDAATSVQTPAHVAGTDYAIYLCDDGVLRADANFSAPVGWTTANSRKIGGYHFAPGGNAAARNGGDATPALNPHSIWDLKWRPAAPDPRGMTLVAGLFWCDIYLLGVDHHINGTSRHGVTIADGGSPPKTPTAFGGDGSATTPATRFSIGEILGSHGKSMLDYTEFGMAAFGCKESAHRGTDPVTTGLATTNAGASNADELFTSKWGVIQAAGVQWIWGRDLGYRADGADVAALTAYGWKAQTGGRGELYTQSDNGIAASLFGGRWVNGSACGSRASSWLNTPWSADTGIGGRGRCGHLIHV